jgi:hypothetical protein
MVVIVVVVLRGGCNCYHGSSVGGNMVLVVMGMMGLEVVEVIMVVSSPIESPVWGHDP